MKGSGKQVLLRILTELSQRLTPENELSGATRRLRTGLLMHGSTADESYEHASRLVWASRRDEAWQLKGQGIAVGKGKVFLTDLHDTVFGMAGLEEHVLANHPNLGPDGYEAFEWVMWLLVSSVGMYDQLLSVESSEELDVDRWVEVYSRHYDHHFLDKARARTYGWPTARQGLGEFANHESNLPMFEAMLRAFDVLEATLDPRVQPRFWQGTLLLDTAESDQSVYVEWRHGQYRIGCLDPQRLSIDETCVVEDPLAQVVRACLATVHGH